MNRPLTDDLVDQLRGNPLQQLGTQLGISPDQAMQAVTTALPLLLGAMQRNSRNDDGARSLFSALEQDHRGLDPANVLGSALAGGAPGEGILGHLLGSRRPAAEQALGSASGLGQGAAGVLLRVLAPIAMAYLSRRMFTPHSADGASTLQPSPEGLRSALDSETQTLRSRPGAGAELLAQLDRDHDGDVDADDALNAMAQPTETAEMRSPRPLL